jgi:L-ribulose-5-phosphate 3-epimerase
MTYDIGNSASLGYDASEEIYAYGERIVNVHVKDRLKGDTNVPLGQGHADFETVFSALNKISYSGPLILQVARNSHLPETEWAKTNRTFVEKYF